MKLEFNITYAKAHAPGLLRSYCFDSAGGTIGRTDAATWALIDPYRTIESQHALIKLRDNDFYIEPIGSGVIQLIHPKWRTLDSKKSQLISNGYFFRLGGFDICARIISSHCSSI